MLNFNRNDRLPEPKDTKLPQRPAPLGAAPTPAPTSPASNVSRPAAQPVAASPAPEPVLSNAASATDVTGSRLSIGPNINLKGVEISNCDSLVIEGNVDATITSKAMEIAKPGRFNGTANIDVAEIHGDFAGELTARSKLVVHGTGRVTGTIRYGKLVVAEGGSITGELKQLETSSESSTSAPSATMPRPLLNPQPH